MNIAGGIARADPSVAAGPKPDAEGFVRKIGHIDLLIRPALS